MYGKRDDFGVEAGRIMSNQDLGGDRSRHVVGLGHQGGGGSTAYASSPERSFVENPSHFRPQQPSQAHQRVQSHQLVGVHQPEGQYLAHGRYSSATQPRPPSHTSSLHLGQSRSIPAPAPSAQPSTFQHQQQQQVRYVSTSQRHTVIPALQPPSQSPSVAHFHQLSASSPRPVNPPDSYASLNAQHAEHQVYQRYAAAGARQGPARRMSLERSIAANLPPPVDSPQARREGASPRDTQQAQETQSRISRSRSGQGLVARMIEEEEEEEDCRITEVLGSRNAPPLKPPYLDAEYTPRVDDALQRPSPRNTQTGPDARTMPAIFHTYVLDYLQRAGFLTTAAAFLSETPAVFTHPPESGRSYPIPPPGKTPVTSLLPSSSFATQSPARASPNPTPLFRSESGSPVSPVQHDATNHSTIESTSSTSTAMTQYGFDRSKSNGLDEEQPSPHERKRRGSTRKDSMPDSMPAADVEHEVENGFLYEWFHVFHDVHAARTRAGGSGPARTLVAANSAASSIGSRLRPIPSRQAPGQPQRLAQLNPSNVGRAFPTSAQQQVGPQSVPRRQSLSQLSTNARMNHAALSQSGSPNQAPPLSRQTSQQRIIQVQPYQQRDHQAREQAARERQRLQQIQMEQVEMQNEMLSDSRQNNGMPDSSASVPSPSGVPGYVPDRLARTNETFSKYHASLVANQRSQLTQDSPNLSHASISPQPIPDGSRYVLREPLPCDPPQGARNDVFHRPGLQRTLSQPQTPCQDGLMPPPMFFTSSTQGRPPLVRSASTSVVQEDQTTLEISREAETPPMTTKRRRDSGASASGLDSREVKKARSTSDLGNGQPRMAIMNKSPLANETDLSRSSPPSIMSFLPTGRENDMVDPTDSVTAKETGVAPAGPAHGDAELDDTATLLPIQDGSKAGNLGLNLADGTIAANELDVPTMTDAELDAFFAQSMTAIDHSDPVGAGASRGPHPSISVPDTVDFDFTEYDSFFGSGAASYDPTTYDLRV